MSQIEEFNERFHYLGVSRCEIHPESNTLLLTGAFTFAEISEIVTAYAQALKITNIWIEKLPN